MFEFSNSDQSRSRFTPIFDVHARFNESLAKSRGKSWKPEDESVGRSPLQYVLWISGIAVMGFSLIPLLRFFRSRRSDENGERVEKAA